MCIESPSAFVPRALSVHNEIFLFQFNKDFNTGTQSALVQEPDGPPMIKVDKLIAPLQYDPDQTTNAAGFIITDQIKSEALQVDITFSSGFENTYRRKLIITDKCTNTIVGEFMVYAESIGPSLTKRIHIKNNFKGLYQ